MGVHYGLLGRKLGHSWSPRIHSLLGCEEYALFEREPEDIEALLKDESIQALNVTIPYKIEVMPFCDELTDAAKGVGSVNTIVRRNGKLIGHNTDTDGFEYTVRRSGISFEGKKVVVFGGGGASKAIVYSAKKMGAKEIIIVDLGAENNYDNLDRHYDAQILVNATPVGMYPKNGEMLVDPAHFTHCEGAVDIIYNPLRTAFMLRCKELGIPCAGGLPMLVAQAKAAEEMFFDKKIDDSLVESIYTTLASEQENIALIGMPGCGKSTIGALLAEMTGRKAIDLDAQIVENEGISIPEIFEKDGEDYFRYLEHYELEKIGKESGKIIMTGGGIVKNELNYALLAQNSRIYHITRDLSLLPTDGRPISQSTDLAVLYAQRAPLYERFRDVLVNNDSTPEECANAIWSDFNENSRN